MGLVHVLAVTFVLCHSVQDIVAYDNDKPCAARPVSNGSVLCVCTADYCDEIVREQPADNSYVAYTSSEAGLRFDKTWAELDDVQESSNAAKILELKPAKQYQTIEGFGGGITDAAGINWKKLYDPQLMDNLVNSYFSDRGIEYNMMRVPIGGSDFSTHIYAYNEWPENDKKLSNFSLTREDYEYKLPLIKAGMSVSTAPVHIVASTWSPPRWMKNKPKIGGKNKLDEEYLPTYALYHLKFLEKYKEEDVPIWAITTTNEPSNGVIGEIKFNDLGWSPQSMAKWIAKDLGPIIRNSEFSQTKILGSDDQRATIGIWFNLLAQFNKSAIDYLDGVGVHYYTDEYVPASVVASSVNQYPNKIIISTEASEGFRPTDKPKVDLGSWKRAENYIKDIIEDLNNDYVGWIDWNICLNRKGGPNWNKNFVDSPIIVFPERGEFVKQPMFYALGHFSKFVPRGSRRIHVKEIQSDPENRVDHVSVLTPSNTIVSVLYNYGSPTSVELRLGSKSVSLNLDAKAITTVEFPYVEE